MNFIKKYKLQMILLALFLILLSIVLFVFFVFIYHTNNQSRYGSRLDGIENVRIDTTYLDDFKEEVLEKEEILSFNTNIYGRIINITVSFSDETIISDAVLFADELLEFFAEDEEVLNFYDIQLFLKSEDAENENFPAIGYKHHTGSEFIWTNNIEL